MAISFKKLNSPLLDMTDKIMFGKLQGCRVCDVIEDHYEYLIWANKQGMLMFTKIVVETIAEHAGYKNKQQHFEQEIAPWLEPTEPFLSEDIPF